MFRRWIRYMMCSVLLMTSLLCMAGCSGNRNTSVFEAADQEVRGEELVKTDMEEGILYIRLTHSDAEGSLTDLAAEMLRTEVYRNSKGTIRIDIYPNDTLGTLDDSIFDESGAVEIRIGASRSTMMRVAGWGPVLDPEFSLSDLDASLEPGGKLRTVLEENSLEHGMRLAAIFPCTYRVLTSNQKAESVEELKGIKIRVISEGLEASLWESVGMTTHAYPIKQTYLALQQGNVNAQENPFDLICSYRLYEQQKYLIRTNHKVMVNGIYINEAFYQSLTEEQRAMIEDAVDTVKDQYPVISESYTTRMNSTLESAGMKTINWTEEEHQKLMDIWREPTLEFLYETYGEEMVSTVLQALH